MEHWSLPILREKLIKIGAKVVRHGRYITFQLAEVAIPRSPFANTLRLVDGLRPAPLPPNGARSRGLQVARQDSCVPRTPERVLSTRVGRWVGLLIAKWA